ncbi:hypothetical protein EIP75_21625 [Aquabacterium soli]|uniref:TrbM protein n=1 Tax=Aquabacterium soli TaxID=2493092 RepID=A0A3R8T220_9BURK|nr:hypothetical protein [Aquabacterium soli]RRS01178.1 hypothetical protein EIP75_21625 [Aquabacterium soli]
MFKRKHTLAAVSAACVAGIATLAMHTTVYAADGCKFLLCIAGPWKSIPLCVPTVKEVFRDIAKGHGIPSCSMSGAGNSAANNWVNSEQACPVMYRYYGDYGYQGCRYPGQITVLVDGQPWSTVYWDMAGNTSTFWTDKARTALTSTPGSAPLDTTYDTDYATYQKAFTEYCNSLDYGYGYNNYNNYQTYSNGYYFNSADCPKKTGYWWGW